MSRPPKHHNKPLSKHRRPSSGAPAQEAVGLLTQPDSLADARGRRPRKNPRSASPGVDADACGIAPRKNPRSASPGVDADACGTAPRKNPRSTVPGVDADACGTAPRKSPRSTVPGVDADARSPRPRKSPRSTVPGVDADARSPRPRKNSRPVGRGRRPRGRRPNRRRSLSHTSPSLPRLSTDSRDIDGEIALLRSLTNRLLSTRPLDYTQINRCLRLIIRAWSAQAKAPKQLTDEEQIDNLIKKVFHDTVNKGDINFHDLVPVRMARPGDKWWSWRMLLPLKDRWRYGLIDPDEPWPHEENEKLAEAQELDRIVSEAYLKLDELFHDDEDDYDPDPDDDDGPYPDNDDDAPRADTFPSPVGVSLVGTLDAANIDTLPSPVGVPLVGTLDAAHADTVPPIDWAVPNPKPRIARGRPPP